MWGGEGSKECPECRLGLWRRVQLARRQPSFTVQLLTHETADATSRDDVILLPKSFTSSQLIRERPLSDRPKTAAG